VGGCWLTGGEQVSQLEGALARLADTLQGSGLPPLEEVLESGLPPLEVQDSGLPPLEVLEGGLPPLGEVQGALPLL
jgi:hypothetical protein